MHAPARTTLALLLLALPLAAVAPAAQTGDRLPVTGLPTEDSVTAAILETEDLRVMDHLEELANGIGPRLTSSDALAEACQWAAQRFHDFGLENVRLVEWGTFPVGFNRRLMEGRMTAPRKTELVFTTRAWTPGTDGPVRAAVVRAPANEEELEAARGSLAGKWILVNNRAVRFDSDEDDFRSQLGHFLDAEGIAGTIAPSRRPELVRTSGNYRIDPDDLPTRVGVILLQEQWQEMFSLLEDGQEVVAEFDIDVEFVPGPIPLHNVIAEIPGETDEMVIVGGHIDSWDGARGAQDNGTGTSTTLEAARLLASRGIKPKRTIRFMLWSGEEQGLLGSRAYIDQHPEENAQISCVLVHDGGTNACSGIYATPDMLPMFQEVFAPLLAAYGDHEDEHLRFTLEEIDELPRGIGSDHDAYLTAPEPVPGFFWRQRGETSYGYIHHTQNDYVREVRPDYQRYTAKVVAIAAWRFANAEQMVPRTDMFAPPKLMGVRPGDDGVTLDSVSEDGLAAAAGMQAGDKIVRIDDRTVDDRNSLRRAMRDTGMRTEVVVERDGAELSFWFDWEEQTAGRNDG